MNDHERAVELMQNVIADGSNSQKEIESAFAEIRREALDAAIDICLKTPLGAKAEDCINAINKLALDKESSDASK